MTTFEELRRAVEADGCYETRPLASVLSFVVHVAASAALFWASARLVPAAAAPLVFVLASFLFYRIGWLMHDAAHGGTFAGPAANRRFALLCAGVLGEFASGWRYGHNRHHAAPNVRGRDMDQSERWDPERRYRTLAGAFVGLLLFSRFRGRYLPKTLLLVGLRDGYFCFRHHRSRFAGELATVLLGFGAQLAGFIWLFGWAGPIVFFAHTAIGLLYLNTVFSGNHYELASFSEEEAESIPFADLQIMTTRNYAGGVLARFVFGGLENQIEHHLFPSMPRHQLRRAAPRVRAFCEARGLPYRVDPFGRAILAVLRFHLEPRRETRPA